MQEKWKKNLGISLSLLVCFIVIVFSKNAPLNLSKTHFQAAAVPIDILKKEKNILGEEFVEPEKIREGIKTPNPLKGVYVSSWVAGTKSTIDRVINLIDTTSANAIIIDIKDASGRISYAPVDYDLALIGAGTTRIRDLPALVKRLHEKNIYIIGRISVFQDAYYATKFPNSAYKDTRTGLTWNDNKGLSWVKNDNKEFWDYNIAIARDAYNQGFDEINLDYVRYPSDGPLSYLDTSSIQKGRTATMTDFFEYVDQEIRQKSKIPLSVDLFGLTMSAQGDLGIGQVLELVAPYVDYVAPMVYPSHFAKGTYGIADPANQPYAIIHKSLSDGISKMKAINEDPNKLRPWLQDFNLGAVYTPEMVKAQIQASENLGLKSWMLWDPKNIYTKSAL